MKSVSNFLWMIMAVAVFSAPVVQAAYHHEGEKDAGKFLSVYPESAGTKLDHCALCHTGGSYQSGGKTVQVGSCQWCHRTYGYDGSGGASALTGTLNLYGKAYLAANRTAEGVSNIASADSDGDGYSNAVEINAGNFPGNANDHPGLVSAPYRIYTKAQLEAMEQHTQFLLMNTSRSGDFYAEYTGVPMKDLLDDAGILLDLATSITVYAPDGWAQDHPLNYEPDLEMYHVYGNAPESDFQYPSATYYYDNVADQAKNPDYGWCDYSAPSCVGRAHGGAIVVEHGLMAILALKQDGAYLIPGLLNDENKLDGSGPFRVVVPQKYPNAPDQSSRSAMQGVLWPYENGWDHNAGACTRSATIIKVNPLPEGTSDIDILEAGWNYIDQEKIIIYGAIDGTDSNGNGVLDSEEGTSETDDMDGDGIPDYKDADTASVRHAKGSSKIRINCSAGEFSLIQALNETDPALSQTGKPTDRSCPYGALKFNITGLTPGQTVTVELEMPENVPTSATFYKILSTGWSLLAFGSNNGDKLITLTLTDGDPATDLDGLANGTIVDPGVLTTDDTADSDDDDSCFINSLI
jgi:hypothetical protein